MMKITALAMAAVGVTGYKFSDPLTAQEWGSFAVKFNKTYTDEELAFRQGVFATNFARVLADNEALTEAGEDAVNGVTKFMDLTPAEFKSMYLMPNYKSMPRYNEHHFKAGNGTDPVDWRTKGVLTPVKDQGQCGSCWAFSATEAIESYYALSGGALTALSPQQITACDTVDQGCNGGNTETAYAYVQQAGGIETEAAYPYTAGTGFTGQCKANVAPTDVQITGYKSIPQGEDNLGAALAQGPVSVCVAANAFQTYTGGVLSFCPGSIDHCVQAVGFTDDYWIVRNSWATSWGEEGFIRLKRGQNICKISNDVTYPTFSATN